MNGTTEAHATAEQVANYWDWRSRAYDAACSRHPQWHEIFLTSFGEKKFLDLLDMGSGTGFLALGFSERGHRVTGVDLSPEMVEFAKNQAKERGLSVEFLRGDALEPPLFSRRFDGVTCRNLLWTLPDPLKGLKAWKRLLKPGGRVVIADGMWEPRLYLEKEEPVTTKFKEMYSGIRGTLPYFLGMTAGEGEELLKEGGFVSVERHGHLFRENPYEYKNEFFVLSARNPVPGE